ncbi:MAG: trypsin-like peptidase domain-containing protein [Candidatus Sumerlaeia bacterium]|nr:trypsin-like peptidase domain-containing protein [Candidatus Sumerlaeia bacterium]
MKLRNLFHLAALLLAAAPLSALQTPDAQLDPLVLPTYDKVSLVAAALGRQEQTGIFRFAEPHYTALTPEEAGLWDQLPDGRMRWRLRVVSKQAESLNLGFDRFHMPDGGTILLYDTFDPKNAIGPWTQTQNADHGEFWTPVLLSEDLIVEVIVPLERWNELELRLHSVNHGFRGFRPGTSRSGSCNVDVICSEGDGWRDEIDSVGAYTLGGVDTCSGALVNNTAQDLKPYFLTANHCGITTGNAASMVIYWNYENSTCRAVGSGASGGAGNGLGPGSPGAVTNSGAVFRATNSTSDFCLVETSQPLNANAEVYFSGWDARDQTQSAVVAIHHPGVEEKRISFENQPTTITAYLQDAVDPTSTHIRVADWDLGTTEGGSSGSPLFDAATKRIVGQLHGGFAACGNNDDDWYGRVFRSWTGGGTNATRLSNWLDPIGSGVTFLDGRGVSALGSGGAPTIDDSAGDGDGSVERGETGIVLTLPLRNGGTSGVTNIAAVLTSNSPGVAVDQGASAYANLAASQTGSNATPFVISVGEDHPCGAPVSLTLTATATEEAAPVIVAYTIPTGPTCNVIPNLAARSWRVTDGLGNGNGVAEPGETVSLWVEMENTEGAATGASATLLMSSPTVSIVTGTAAYPDMPSGSDAENLTPFLIALSESHPCGQPIPFDVLMETAQGDFMAAATITHPTDAGPPQGFEAPSLPAGWTAPAGTGSGTWQSAANANAYEGTRVATAQPPATAVSDKRLVSPALTGVDRLAFRHTFDMEASSSAGGTAYDGAVIEVSTAGPNGPWTDLGPLITSGGYNLTMSTQYSSPISGRQCWSGGTVGAMSEVVVDLSTYSAQTIHVAFRWTTDSSVASDSGWFIDSVVFNSPAECEPVTAETLEGWIVR